MWTKKNAISNIFPKFTKISWLHMRNSVWSPEFGLQMRDCVVGLDETALAEWIPRSCRIFGTARHRLARICAMASADVLLLPTPWKFFRACKKILQQGWYCFDEILRRLSHMQEQNFGLVPIGTAFEIIFRFG